MYEQPRHVLISVRASPMVEMARWFLERYHISYVEKGHVPLFHVLATRAVRGGDEVPVVATAEGNWCGAREFLVGLDAKTRSGERLLGEEDAKRRSDLEFIETLFNLLLQPVRRYVYYHLLPHRSLVTAVAAQNAPMWEGVLLRAAFPLWRKLMARALDFSEILIRQAPIDIEKAFSLIEERLGNRQPFLSGNSPGTLDIVFSALIAPVVFPGNYGAWLPDVGDLPKPLRDFVNVCRDRPAGQLALNTYAQARPLPQQRMRSRGFSYRQRRFVYRIQLAAANLLRCVTPRLIFGKWAVFSRWADVQEILAHDLDFCIAPINGSKVDEINGPFVLGLDRGPQLIRERKQMYAALVAIDIAHVRDRVRREATHLLDHARRGLGRIDVVNGYARLIAARTASDVFGVSGPNEAELMLAARRTFHHLFLNFGNKGDVRNRALEATNELQRWIKDAVAEQSRDRTGRRGLIGALLARQDVDPDALDDDGIRRTVSGLLIGSIDTTATVVAHVIGVILWQPEIRVQVMRDLENFDRVRGWCWEALRHWPHNPVLLRHARTGTAFGTTKFKRDTTIFAGTLGAMNDPSAFPRPNVLDPLRSDDRYLHFGGGLHSCAGRQINAVQIPELVRQLLLFGAETADRPRFEGPFVDELVVSIPKIKSQGKSQGSSACRIHS